ncbi:DUF2268 domain-containing putative Zn-dependent protease [Thalassotalea marina]|uniref:DUF2268 domain-containing protein n=1 Tax=Thalassotalea marina TaxID=1673741 RepID=A0A919BJA8_9GAMM|nr:DUF2268 domain-containing putative Zn-dependent protease [Thalassotalea marina]GHF91591.1 hypothetical protein GCM10017161_19330 [Thalassotalea marina]
MPTKITILNASGKFSRVLDLLESRAQRSLADIKAHIELPNIDIVISPCSDEYKTESGILGCVSSQYVIDILLDADHANLVDIINRELTAVIAHELHHVIRQSAGIKNKNLIENLITEGLACHFETKFNGNTTPRFFDEIKQYDWRDLFHQMKPHLQDIDFDYPVYFAGKDTKQFPNRAGYWVGFNLVSQYISKHGGCAVSLVASTAEELRI